MPPAAGTSCRTWQASPSPRQQESPSRLPPGPGPCLPGASRGQRNDENRMTAPARRPALGDAGYRGDPALNADSEVQRYRRSCRTRLDSIRVTGRVQLAAARFVTGWPVARVATTIGVSQRQVQRYLAAADLPSKRRAKRILATERARARQPKEHDSAPGELTGRESTKLKPR